MQVFLIRVGVFLLSAVALGIAAVPILALIDLLDGGTGWGLCPNGIEACDNPITTAGEVAVYLALGLFLVVLGLRLLMRAARTMKSETAHSGQSSQ